MANSRSPRSEDTDRAARKRLLDGAVRQVASIGAAEVALSDIARDAGVSKALIHYHFVDKDTLLARVIEHLVQSIVTREEAALAQYENEHSPLAVDALWAWLDDELRRGDIRVLLELDAYRGAAVRSAARTAAARRLAAAEQTVTRLFTVLDLRPRVEPSLMATVFLAFVDGLAFRWELDGRDEASASAPAPRVAFDVFWLAMLSLAE